METKQTTDRAAKLRLRLQKKLNALILSGTNTEAGLIRQDFNAIVKENPWAKVEIHANKVTVTEK